MTIKSKFKLGLFLVVFLLSINAVKCNIKWLSFFFLQVRECYYNESSINLYSKGIFKKSFIKERNSPELRLTHEKKKD